MNWCKTLFVKQEKALGDPYLFIEEVFKVKYDDIKLFVSTSKMNFLTKAINIKLSEILHSYIYTFQNNEIRGFQFDVVKNKNAVKILFFDQSNNCYDFLIYNYNSQAEIDFLYKKIIK